MAYQTMAIGNAIKKLAIIAIIVIVVAACFLFLSAVHFQTEEGYAYYYQNTLTGTTNIYTEPEVHFRIPWFSRVTPYKQVITVAFGSTDASSRHMTQTEKAIEVRFADTYTGTIPATFRYKLPLDKKKIATIHREFRSFDNLVYALLIKTSREVVVNTATQYTGEEFFQSGLNQFKVALIDQLRNGIYKTERKQVKIEQMDLTPICLAQEDSTQSHKPKMLVWKTVPVKAKGGKKVRLNNSLDGNPLKVYGIELTQVTIGTPVPEPELDKLLVNKKRFVAAVLEQKTAKMQQETAQFWAEQKCFEEALKQYTDKAEPLIQKVKKLTAIPSQYKDDNEILKLKVEELAAIAKQYENEIAEMQKDKEVIENH
jgi:regulator of protease activity HflC (stomatin/prohibitin superfamily)